MQVTYGLVLGPVSEANKRAPLTFPETEMVALPCLLAQDARREVLWHLRGLLRSGLSEAEVEEVQRTTEDLAREMGAPLPADMPRVSDVTEVDDLS
jgi:hypothetical protein